MLRFIVSRVSRDQGHVSTRMVTVDADVPELEKEINCGGWGGGMNGDDFLYGEVTGVQVLPKP